MREAKSEDCIGSGKNPTIPVFCFHKGYIRPRTRDPYVILICVSAAHSGLKIYNHFPGDISNPLAKGGGARRVGMVLLTCSFFSRRKKDPLVRNYWPCGKAETQVVAADALEGEAGVRLEPHPLG